MKATVECAHVPARQATAEELAGAPFCATCQDESDRADLLLELKIPMSLKLTLAQRKQRDKLLKDSGFVDLEDEHGEMDQSFRALKGHSKRWEADEIASLADYYRRAAQLLHDHAWKSPVERRIWELHADGASYTRVARTVKREIETGALPREKMYRRRVHATVTRARAILMGQGPKKRGPKAKPDSLRAEGTRLGLVLLSPAAVLALDHIRTRLQVSKAEAVRRGLQALSTQIRKA